MQHIIGISYNQIIFNSLEELIASDNPVRFIDAFVAEQPHQFNGTRKSKWRTRPDYASI